MGRAKLKDDLWRRSGGVEVIITQFHHLNILEANTKWNSEIWRTLSQNIFGKDKASLRTWLHVVWHDNRRGVKTSVKKLSVGCAIYIPSMMLDNAISKKIQENVSQEDEADHKHVKHNVMEDVIKCPDVTEQEVEGDCVPTENMTENYIKCPDITEQEVEGDCVPTEKI